MVAAVIRAAYARNVEFLFYIAVMVMLIGALLWVHHRIALSRGLLWALAVWGALHMAGGLIPVPEHWPIDGDIRVLYSWWILPKLKYDQVTHAYGFGATTWLCWQGLRGALADYRCGKEVRPTLGLLVIVAAAGCGFGALNEVVEFFATRFTVTNVGGYENTHPRTWRGDRRTCAPPETQQRARTHRRGWDLVYNALGAVTAAALIYVCAARDSKSEEQPSTQSAWRSVFAVILPCRQTFRCPGRSRLPSVVKKRDFKSSKPANPHNEKPSMSRPRIRCITLSCTWWVMCPWCSNASGA